MKPLRINAWSSPRNISTALMYAFAQRPDTRVVDEPLYAHYLAHQPTEAIHPGREAILASQSPEGKNVVRDILLGDYEEEVVFFKQMTHHLHGLALDFLASCRNILLIRDPRAILASFAKVVPNPGLEDIGIVQQVRLHRHLCSIGHDPLVLDARQLLLDPKVVLQKLCARLDLPFHESMLHWPAGGRPEDGVWAKYWYASVHRSTGFRPYQEREHELPRHLDELARQAEPLYQTLFEHALRADQSSTSS